MIDLTRSKFDIGGNGFIQGAFIDGSISNITNTNGWISGTVTDVATGDPVSDVSIQIYDASGNYVDVSYTDAVGYYELYAGLPGGTYFAATDNYEGYINEVYDDLPCTGVCDPTVGTAIVVTGGITTVGVDFTLKMYAQDPVVDIKANGSDGPLLIAFGPPL